MNNYFMVFACFLLLAKASLGMEILDEHIIESDSHKGITGKYVFTQRLVHDSSKVGEVKKRVPFPQFISEDLKEIKGQQYNVEMGQNRIVQDERSVIATFDIRDCIGITVWDPETKTAALYHASKMELRENTWMFNDYFLGLLKGKISKPETCVVKLSSCYWSNDLFQVIELMGKGGFKISGLWIPDAYVEDTSEFIGTTYVNKATTSRLYHSWENGMPSLSMKISTSDGKVEVQQD